MKDDRRLAHDWFDAPLPSNVEIGDGSWLYSSFAFLHYRSQQVPGLRVGVHSGLYDGTHFELGENAVVSIGDHTAVVGAILNSNGRIDIGSYCFIAHEVFIADYEWAIPPIHGDAVRGDDIVIGDDVWIGARAVISGPLRIGDGAVIGAGAVITGDVPPYAVAAGNPWRIVGWSRPKAK